MSKKNVVSQAAYLASCNRKIMQGAPHQPKDIKGRPGGRPSLAEQGIRAAQRALIASGAHPGSTKRKGHRKRKFWGQP